MTATPRRSREIRGFLNAAVRWIDVIPEGVVEWAAVPALFTRAARRLSERSLTEVRLETEVPRFERVALHEFIEGMDTAAAMQAKGDDWGSRSNPSIASSRSTSTGNWFLGGCSARSEFGLGLSSALSAARATSGELSVRDVPGKGCVFTIDLPRQPLLSGATFHVLPDDRHGTERTSAFDAPRGAQSKEPKARAS